MKMQTVPGAEFNSLWLSVGPRVSPIYPLSVILYPCFFPAYSHRISKAKTELWCRDNIYYTFNTPIPTTLFYLTYVRLRDLTLARNKHRTQHDGSELYLVLRLGIICWYHHHHHHPGLIVSIDTV